MTLKIHIDFETRSKIDLNKVGAWNYARHPSTEILCVSWSVGNEVKLAHPAFPKAYIPAKNWPPVELFELIKNRENLIYAHNAFFERVIWHFICHRKLEWPPVKHRQWRCTMAIASYYALPRKLEQVALALGTHKKDMDGNKVMLKCSSPNKEGEWHEDPDDLKTTFQYNIDDIHAEKGIHDFLGDLPPFEQEIWLLDQKINSVGIPFDIDMAESAVKAVERAKAQANIALFELTEGMVETTGAINTWNAWTEKMKYPMKGKSLAQDLIDGYLHNPKIPKIIKDAIEIKKSASASSVSKYKKILELVDRLDARVRDGLYYFGAGTGRYAGRGVQIQNFPKGYSEGLKGIWENDQPWMDEACDNIALGAFDLNQMLTGHSIFKQLRDATRGVIKAKPGHEFLVVDYSAIEARVVTWLADDQDALKVLKESCIYCDLATTIYGYLVEKATHPSERQLGKQGILGCFGPDTLVFTKSGLKKIIDIKPTDLVWDGENWVSHEGVIFQGVKETLTLGGVQATPDHLIQTGDDKWVKFQALKENMNYLKLGVEKGNLALKALYTENGAGLTAYKFHVVVTLKKYTLFHPIIFLRGVLLDVIHVLKKLLLKPLRNIGNIQIYYQMIHIGLDYLTAFLVVSKDAITKIRKFIFTMGLEVLKFLKNGAKTEGLFSSISYHLKVGMTQLRNLIGSMWIKATSPTIYVSLVGRKICQIRERLLTCRKKSKCLSPTYDILNSGPKNRFLILTGEGPLLAHNCGYGMGFIKFFITLQGYNIDIPEDTCNVILGDEKAKYLKQVIRSRVAIAKADIDIQSNLLALAASLKIVRTYREKYSKIVKFWYDTEDAAKKAVANPGEVYTVGKISWSYDTHKDFLSALLPSGRCINYHKPRLDNEYTVQVTVKDKKGLDLDLKYEKLKYLVGDEVEKLYSRAISKGFTIDPNREPFIRESSVLSYLKPANGKSERTGTYSGKLVENLSQGVARDFMCHSMLLADKKGYNLIMTVHDEIVAEEKEGTKDLKEFEQLLCVLPEWGDGFPVGVEGFKAKRYRK